MSLSKGNMHVTKRNPFEEPPQQRAFYHPGSPKSLAKHQRKIALSPDRNAERTKGSKDAPKSLEDELFLSGSHVITNGDSVSLDDGSSKFDESWLSSERPSLGEGIAEKSQYDFDRFVNLKKRLEFPERDSLISSVDNSIHEKERADRGSTLAKYVERFRKGEPKSRAEREQKEGRKTKDFWWLSTNPPVNDSQTTSYSKHSKSRSPVSPYRVTSKTERLTAAKLASHISSRLPGDEETRLLQEKADRLLEQSGSSECSSGMAVSTEGLGSSPSTASVHTDHSEERAYRPAFTKELRGRGQLSSVKPVTRSGQSRPEDDILYQWRLKRKMELAQDSSHFAPLSRNKPMNTSFKPVEIDSKLAEFRDKLSHFPSPTCPSKRVEFSAPVHSQPYSGDIQFTPAPSQTVRQDTQQQHSQVKEKSESPRSYPEKTYVSEKKGKVDGPIASPTLHRKPKEDKEEGVPPPHLHLMCDILPCPHQQQYLKEFGDEGCSESDTEDDRNSSVQYKQYLQAERPDSDHRKRNKDSHEKVKKIYHKEKNNSKSVSVSDYKKSTRPPESNVSTQNKTVTDAKLPVNGQGQISHKGSRQKLKQNDTSENSKQSIPNRSRRKLIQETREVTVADTTVEGGDRSSKLPLESAIGQVVNGYLFEASQSLNSTTESELPARESETCEKLSDTDADDFSDGEEFSEDSLLQHLRQQRAQFEQQLKDIDVALSQIDV